MADLDLSMVVRVKDEGASAAGAKLGQTLDDVARSERNAASAATETATASAAAATARKEFNEALGRGATLTQAAETYEAALNRELRATGGAGAAAATGLKGVETQSRRTSQGVRELHGSTKQARAGVQQLGMQFGDFTQQASIASSPSGVLMAFSQQAGQAAYAASMMGGKLGAVGTFMAGPWGAMILAAVSVLGMLALKMGEAEESSDKLKTAADYQKMSLEGLTEALEESNEALERSIRTGREAEQATLDQAEQIRAGIDLKRRDTIATLENARANAIRAEAVAAGQSGEEGRYARMVAGVATSRVAQLEADIAELTSKLGGANLGVGMANIPLLQREARARTDPALAAAEKRDRTLESLNRAYEREVVRARGDTARKARADADYARAVEAATRIYNREVESAREAGRRPRRTRTPRVDGDETTLDPALRNSTVTGRFGEQRGSRRHGGTDWRADVGTPVYAPATGSVERAGPVGDYGNMIELMFGRNSSWRGAHLSRMLVRPGDVVERGQLIGYTGGAPGAPGSGNSRAPHLHEEIRVGGRTRDPAGNRRVPTDEADVIENSERVAERLADEAAALERWGDGVEDTVRRIATAFTDTPPVVAQVTERIDQLDEIIEQLRERRPVGFEQMIADAEAAKIAVREGLNRPIEEYLESQVKARANQALINQGRHEEAEVLRIIADLEEKRGQLSDDQKAAVRASVAATRTQARDADVDKVLQSQRERLGIQHLIGLGLQAEADALEIILGIERERGPLAETQRDAILDGVYALQEQNRQLEIARGKQEKFLTALGDVRSLVGDILSGSIDKLTDIPNRLVSSFQKLSGAMLEERLFGDTFRQLEDQITGANGARVSAENFARTLDTVNPALVNLANAANGAAAAVSGEPAPGEAVPLPGLPTTARPTTAQGFFVETLKKLAKGVGISDDGAKKIGEFGAKAIAGAATGAMVAGFGKMLGIRTSSTGGQIGGAVGKMSGLPGGEIIGSIVGSIGGGIISGGPKSGSATIRSTFDDPSARGNRGQSAAATGVAKSIQDSIANIAETLGGGLGAFNVSIGKRGDDWRVDSSGRGRTKKSKGAKDFGDDQAAAMQFAIMDAIKDGAVTGLSAAVSAALKSSTDLDRALREALKVKDLEDLIGGLGSKLSKPFRDFDRVAEERVRIAKKYGLDLLAVERVNAEERMSLIENVIKSRIGGLTDFQNEMRFGDLFEGDAPTRRAALLGEIDKVGRRADAGEEGAGDQLVDLYRRLLDTSKEAFGTAGPELAADRALATAGVERVIQMENERLAAATRLSVEQIEAIRQGNTLSNEANNLLAGVNTRLDALIAGGGVRPVANPAALAAVTGRGGGGGGFGGLFDSVFEMAAR